MLLFGFLLGLYLILYIASIEAAQNFSIKTV